MPNSMKVPKRNCVKITPVIRKLNEVARDLVGVHALGRKDEKYTISLQTCLVLGEILL